MTDKPTDPDADEVFADAFDIGLQEYLQRVGVENQPVWVDEYIGLSRGYWTVRGAAVRTSGSIITAGVEIAVKHDTCGDVEYYSIEAMDGAWSIWTDNPPTVVQYIYDDLAERFDPDAFVDTWRGR